MSAAAFFLHSSHQYHSHSSQYWCSWNPSGRTGHHDDSANVCRPAHWWHLTHHCSWLVSGPITHRNQRPWRLHRCRYSGTPVSPRVAEEGPRDEQLGGGGGQQEAVPAHLPGEWVRYREACSQRDKDVDVCPRLLTFLGKTIALHWAALSNYALLHLKTFLSQDWRFLKSIDLQLGYFSAKMCEM